MHPILLNSSLSSIVTESKEEWPFGSRAEDAIRMEDSASPDSLQYSREENSDAPHHKIRRISTEQEVVTLCQLSLDVLYYLSNFLGAQDILNISAVSRSLNENFSLKKGRVLYQIIVKNITTIDRGWIQAKQERFGLPNCTSVVRAALDFMEKKGLNLTVEDRSCAIMKFLEKQEFSPEEGVLNAVRLLLADAPIQTTAKFQALRYTEYPYPSTLFKTLLIHPSIGRIEPEMKQQILLESVQKGRLDKVLALLMDGPVENDKARNSLVKLSLLEGYFDILQALLQNRPNDNFIQAFRQDLPIDDFTEGTNLGELVANALVLLRTSGEPLNVNERDRLLLIGMVRLDAGIVRAALADGDITLRAKYAALFKATEIGALDIIQALLDHDIMGTLRGHYIMGTLRGHFRTDENISRVINQLVMMAAENGWSEIVATLQAVIPSSPAVIAVLEKMDAIQTALLNHQEIPTTTTRTKLMVATRCGCAEEVRKILLSNEPIDQGRRKVEDPMTGLSLDAIDMIINRITIVAARHGHFNILRTLIDLEFPIRNREKTWGLILARRGGHWNIVTMLMNYRALAARFSINDAIREDIQRGSICGLSKWKFCDPNDAGFLSSFG